MLGSVGLDRAGLDWARIDFIGLDWGRAGLGRARPDWYLYLIFIVSLSYLGFDWIGSVGLDWVGLVWFRLD